MKYEDIKSLESTLSQNNAEKILYEVCFQNWRCYSTAFTNETEALIQRFLASHARTPGILTEEMLALMPIDVFRYTNQDNGVRVEGATFTNGAVVTVIGRDYSQTKLLFVDDRTAERWKYPLSFRYLGRKSDPSPPAVPT